MIEINPTTPIKKKPALPRRPRLRDWPMRGYRFNVEIVGDLPPWVDETEDLMIRCWNDMRGELGRALKALPEDAECKGKSEAIKPFRDTKVLRGIAQKYLGRLPSTCYYLVSDRFLKVMQEWPRHRSRIKNRQGYAPFECGMPRFKHPEDENDLQLPVSFNRTAGHEVKFADLYDTDAGNVSLWRLVEASPGADHNLQFRLPNPVRGTAERTPIKAVINFQRNLPPASGIVKSVCLSRRSRKPFDPQWTISFTLEMPPVEPRTKTSRVAGYDSGGWRIMGQYIRVGVLTDNAGFSYEIMFPVDLANYSERRDIAEDRITSLPDYIEISERVGKLVQNCKDELKKIFEEEKHQWPAAAVKSMNGIVKMRQDGLKTKILSVLEFGFPSSKAISLLKEWQAEDERLYRIYRIFQIKAERKKEDAWRQVSVWIAKNFDVIAWEADLKLNQMAEAKTSDPALQRAQRYRQFAGQFRLREFVKQAMAKYGRTLQAEKAAYSTRTCSECGGAIPKGRKLVLVCENGHKQDQDENASKLFLNRIEGYARISEKPVEIPIGLTRYLRLMTASETGIEVVK